jgi:tetratricopeptide (TPR) repeat protein
MPRSPTRPLIALALAALMAGLPVTAPAADGSAGAYLAARVAASENDFREAALWYDRLIDTGHADAALLEGAIIAHLSLGEVDQAADLSRRLIQVGGRSQSAYIALLADQAARGDFTGVIADTQAGRSIGRLLDALVMAWAALGEGRMSDAVADFDTLAKSPGLEAFGLYHKALALASAGDFEGADNILSGREAGQIALMRRGAIAHAHILSQLERNPDALALLEQAVPAIAEDSWQAVATRLREALGDPTETA